MSAVMTEATPSAADAAVASMQELFERQRKAFLDDLPVSADLRRDRLSRAIAMLVDHQDGLCEAMRADFGHRPVDLSKFADVVGSVTALRHARSHVRRWMKPDRRPVRFPLGLIGARARIEYQPKGVVGIISPWNFPVAMSFQPLAGAFAAGNRVMLKPSEATPATSDLMARLVAEHFDETEFTVVTGGPEVGIAFSQLPFDHLFFTGSTTVGRHIMRAAADNLTPVTLELGGKSPAIIGSGADIEQAAERIALGKMMNAGQVCLAPDYVLVPEAEQSRFVDALKARVQSMYPQAAGNDDYTMVINDRHADRIRGLVKEATEAGAEVINAQPTHEDGADRRIPLTLVLNPDEELGVMREEIFGPILP
ncbi:MAG: aldehyde dehydrogenase family protein, partial [Pseudomonadota bacterium]